MLFRSEAKFSGYFQGAAPIAYIAAGNIVTYGTHNIYKVVFTAKPADRPQFNDFAGTIQGYCTVQEQIQSIIPPTGAAIEPKFFYTTDSAANGYFIETTVVARINAVNAQEISVRWGSIVPDDNTRLISGYLRLTKLAEAI